jgi:crossover junction endodeoxyribonuclease RuvC
VVAARVHKELAVHEYTALQLKKAVAGHGRAGKAEVQQMVMRLLKLPGLPGPDAADALGLAITHAQVGASLDRLQRARVAAGASDAQSVQRRYRDSRLR